MQNEIETHTKPGALTVYTHYGPSRTKDARILIDHNVVLTTYGVLGSEFQSIEVQLLFFQRFTDDVHV
jgi:DNA repair protein RAD5